MINCDPVNSASFSDYRLTEEARSDDEFKTWLTDEKSDWDMEWLEEAREKYLAYLKEGF